MTSVEIVSFTGTTPANVYYCNAMSASCVFVASVSVFPYSFDVPSSYDFENFIVKVTDAQNCTVLEYVYILPTLTPTVTNTPFLTPSETPTNTPTTSETATPTTTVTPTKSAPTPTPTRTPAQTPLPPCESPTPTPTISLTPTITPTLGLSPTPTPTNTPTPSITPSITPSVTPTISETPTETPTQTPTETITPTITLTPTETQTPTPSSTETPTPTPSITPTITSSETPTPTLTITPTITSSITPTNTPTPSQTPAVEFNAFLFVETNQVAPRTAMNTYMAAQGSGFRGFNINSPTLNNSTTFNNQMNSYLRYSGWGVSQPAIVTGKTYNISRGTDNFGVPISAFTLTTTIVPSGTTTPTNTLAWYTWFIPTGATNNQRYSTISQVFNNTTTNTQIPLRAQLSSQILNYTGGTNIPNGTYRVYSSFTVQSMRFAQNNRNIYYRGGPLI